MKMLLKKGFECNCDFCQSLCYYRVGWFLPEEAFALIEYFQKEKGLSLKEILTTKLVVDWWEGSRKAIYLLAPRWTNCGNKLFAPFVPVIRDGKCVFKEKDKCLLHTLTYKGIPLKPYECRVSGCKAGKNNSHFEVAMAWKEYQKELKELIEQTFGESLGKIYLREV